MAHETCLGRGRMALKLCSEFCAAASSRRHLCLEQQMAKALARGSDVLLYNVVNDLSSSCDYREQGTIL